MLWVKTCPREQKNCFPYSNIVSDDNTTFICCGDSNETSRSIVEDKFRICFKNHMTDSMFDCDEADLKDQIAIMADALALSHRMEP